LAKAKKHKHYSVLFYNVNNSLDTCQNKAVNLGRKIVTSVNIVVGGVGIGCVLNNDPNKINELKN
jgi:hypothetical protein